MIIIIKMVRDKSICWKPMTTVSHITCEIQTFKMIEINQHGEQIYYFECKLLITIQWLKTNNLCGNIFKSKSSLCLH